MKNFLLILFFILICGCLDETKFETTKKFSTSTTNYEKTSTTTLEKITSTTETTTKKTSTTTLKKITSTTETTTKKTSTTTLEKISSTTETTTKKTSTTTLEKILLASTTKDDGIFFVKQSLCFDSDGGLNTDVKGYVETKDGRHYDECIGKKILENYCNKNIAKTLEIICAYGCSSGVCQPQSKPATNTQI